MRYIFTILTVFLLLTCNSAADETIKVLMMESPYEQFPSTEAETVGNIKGKIFIKGQLYSGLLKVIKDRKGLYVINNLPFEEYIEGVVNSEIGGKWELEALKAQAVISRTYATFYKQLNTDKDFHLTSTVLHQLYKGENSDPLISFAVEETKGEILTYNHKPIKAVFHATCEGSTERPEEVWDGSYPYLKSVKCNGRNAPYKTWQRAFSLNKLGKALRINNLTGISIASYTSTGRANKLHAFFKSGNKIFKKSIRANNLRKFLGYKELPSTHFKLSKSGRHVIFTGQGYGHAVGLSQWGAREMAQEGKNYREILTHFYPGASLTSNETMYSHNTRSD